MLQEVDYLDWNDSLGVLERSYKSGLFVLIIGPKGTGKTTLVREFANSRSARLDSINFSLRTRESHLVGSKTLNEGSIGFGEGLLTRSMKDGTILYLDELNAAEGDVLLRLDEALDDRRQLVLKEAAGQTVTASEGWFVIATINPLTHVGTKELPPQLLSRFPVRIRLEYPPDEIELKIAKKHVPDLDQNIMMRGIRLANTLRQAAAVEELFYAPSMRETIAFAKLTSSGKDERNVAYSVFANVYAQWGDIEYRKVSDIIDSMFGA